MLLPEIGDVHQARERIASLAHRTPVLTSKTLDARFGAELYFKCENFQRAGAFKFRGACNAVLAANDAELRAGVATHSSGNHAQALSLAAQIRNVPATIVMPSDATEVKRLAVEGYGANVVLCEPTLESREATLKAIVEETGAHVVHPYDNHFVISGQGTAALEIIDEVSGLDTIIAPVGGGGLLAGTAVVAGHAGRAIQVIGAEPDEADDAYRSVAAGHIIPVGQTTTIADGLRTSLGERNFALMQQHHVQICTASEAAITAAMRLVWERMKIIIEPSSAVTLAVLMEKRDAIPGARIGVIFTGGNVDLERLPF